MTFLEFLWLPYAQYRFMQTGFIAILALAIGCTPVGVFLVTRRMSLIGDALGHAILPGVALGFMAFGLSLTAMSTGGFLSALFVLLLAGLSTRVNQLKEDANLSVMYLSSLSIGVVLVSKFGTNVDLIDILFGSLLAVSAEDLVFLATIASFSLVTVMVFFRVFVLDSFDPGFFATQGRSNVWVQFVLLSLVAVNIVTGFQTMGTLMTVGFMMLPCIILRMWTKHTVWMMFGGMALAIIAGYLGLLLSFYTDVPPGPSIILTLALFFIASLFFGRQSGILWRWIKFAHYQH